jgi:hypothetical protein
MSANAFCLNATSRKSGVSLSQKAEPERQTVNGVTSRDKRYAAKAQGIEL